MGVFIKCILIICPLLYNVNSHQPIYWRKLSHLSVWECPHKLGEIRWTENVIQQEYYQLMLIYEPKQILTLLIDLQNNYFIIV